MKVNETTPGSLASPNRAKPPLSDQLEVSFFGPSYGESIVIHIGSGQWVIVDSCLSPITGRPQALEYLETIGADLSLVRFIVATHFDDDHIRGLARCVASAPNADFVISAAVASEDLMTLLHTFARNAIGVETGVKEIDEVLDCMRRRKKHPVLAAADKQLLHFRTTAGPEVELVALSPSDATIIDGHLNVGKMLQTAFQDRVRLPECSRNDRSIVLWLRMGSAVVLLGSDLSESGDTERGWSAIILSDIKRAQAFCFKIPHHGSKTSHHDAIWTQLLGTNPPSIIIPWRKGIRALPTRQDIERFQQLTEHLYVTTIPQIKRRQRAPEVEQMIRRTTLEMRQLNLTSGHVRIRADTKADPPAWSVELFNGARRVEGRMSKAFFDPTSRNHANRLWLS